MIVGDPTVFAIESRISEAYEESGLCALGCFLLHVGGMKYGVDIPNASMLGCSLDEVKRRLECRGEHTMPLLDVFPAKAIAGAVYDVIYGEQPRNNYFGTSASDLEAAVRRSRVIWAPDGDEAFDDGSYVLQFDVDGRVRLIAFKSTESGDQIPDALREIWITGDQFYNILRAWRNAFVGEWRGVPKTHSRGQ